MKIDQGCFCPFIKKDCVKTKCAFFTQIRGINPNTGQEIDEWGCAITWLPTLILETASQSRQTGAAVESFRNEMTTAAQTNQQVLMAAAKLAPQILPSANP